MNVLISMKQSENDRGKKIYITDVMISKGLRILKIVNENRMKM